MKVDLIVAMDMDRGIGKNNDLMWHLPEDMKFFKEKTSGHVVIMGRKNYESIPEKYRPLPNRENAVLTRNQEFSADGCKVFNDLTTCLAAYEDDDRTIFIIGGGEIYKLAMEAEVIDEMYITHVHKHYDADTFFPFFDVDQWQIQELASHDGDDRHDAPFKIVKYTRK